MRASERNWIFVVAGLVLVAAFWFVLLAPKRDKASTLSDKITQLETAVSEQKQRAEFAQQAKDEFPSNYEKVVVLGKAAPERSDTASFLVQLNRIAADAEVDFNGISLEEGGSTTPPPAPTTQPGLEQAPPVSSQPTTQQADAESAEPASADESEAAATPAPATEATASTLAIGAGVGPASLSVLRYQLSFDGNFFNVADFINGLDDLITSNDGRLVVDGRLTTIDGFALAPDPEEGFPMLVASFSVTTYLTPPAQGLTAGATPGGPAAPTVPGEVPTQTASTGGTP